MSEWTHSICDKCWNTKNPDRKPIRVIEAVEKKCCFCGVIHKSGIYVRHDPKFTACVGGCE